MKWKTSITQTTILVLMAIAGAIFGYIKRPVSMCDVPPCPELSPIPTMIVLAIAFTLITYAIEFVYNNLIKKIRAKPGQVKNKESF